MNDLIFEKIKEFTIKESCIKNIPLTRNTTLESGLGISGADDVEFIIAYGVYFKVDVSNFMAADYFDAEGGQFLSQVLRFFLGEKGKNPKQKELTLGDLEKGVIAGKLDASIIGK